VLHDVATAMHAAQEKKPAAATTPAPQRYSGPLLDAGSWLDPTANVTVGITVRNICEVPTVVPLAFSLMPSIIRPEISGRM
jgi:hypothetical protein